MTVNHFRGYRYHREFDLDNRDIAVLAGPNGYGKTSFFDAVEWALTGKLYRYELANDERNTSRFINFQPFNENAVVSLDFSNGDKKYTITRECINHEDKATDYGENRTKVTLTGSDINTLSNKHATNALNKILVYTDWQSKIRFEDVFSQYHLLTQDKLKHFIQGARGTERFLQLSVLLGTDRFSKYKDSMKCTEDYFAQKVKNLQTDLQDIDARITVLKEQISNNEATNIEDKLTGILVMYNLLEINLPEMHEKDLVKRCMLYKKYASTESNTIETKISNCEQLFSQFGNLHPEISKYQTAKEFYNRLSILPELYTKFLKLDYLIKNQDLYKNFNISSDQLIKKLSDASQIINTLSLYISDIQSIEMNLHLYEKALTAYQASNYESTASFINALDNVILNLKTSNSQIYYRKNEMGGRIGLGEIVLEIPRLVESMSISSILISKMEHIKKICQDTNGRQTNIDKDLDEKRKAKQSIETEIAELNTLDANVRKILNESLLHLSRTTNLDVDCPVCNTSFKTDELIGKIKIQLGQKNPITEQKLNLQQSLINDINNLHDEKAKLVTKLINELTEVATMVSGIVRDIQDLKQLILSEEIKCKELITSLKDNKKMIEDSQKTYMSYLLELNLSSSEGPALGDILTNLNNDVNNQISLLGYDCFNIDMTTFNSNLASYQSYITIFESDLQEKGIQLTSSIEDQVLEKISGYRDQINKLKEQKSLVDLLNVKLDELSKLITEDANRNNLNALVIKRESINSELGDNTRIQNNLKLLQQAVTNSISQINQELIDENREFVNSIFKRLNPHPYFRDVEFNLDFTRQRNNTLYLNCIHKNEFSVNPAYIFSSAQVNILALSIFLSIALRQRCTRLDTFLLDDPIQNMDDMNVIAFIDILRSLGKNDTLDKQIIMSTHDEQFYRLMVKKFRFFKTKAFEFKEYNEEGPSFKTKDIYSEYLRTMNV